MPAEGVTAAELLSRLADLEIIYGTWLRLMVAADRPALPEVDDRALAGLARFRDWTAVAALERPGTGCRRTGIRDRELIQSAARMRRKSAKRFMVA